MNRVMCRALRYPKGIVSSKIKHLRTKPSTPKRKAERFVQTSLREWAYAQAYLTSDHRAQHLPYLASTTQHESPNHPSAARHDREQPVEPPQFNWRPTDATASPQNGQS
jgi:hypothetical protein